MNPKEYVAQRVALTLVSKDGKKALLLLKDGDPAPYLASGEYRKATIKDLRPAIEENIQDREGMVEDIKAMRGTVKLLDLYASGLEIDACAGVGEAIDALDKALERAKRSTQREIRGLMREIA